MEDYKCGSEYLHLQSMLLRLPRGDSRDSNLFANVNRTIGRRSIILSRVWWGRNPTKQSVLALLFPSESAHGHILVLSKLNNGRDIDI